MIPGITHSKPKDLCQWFLLCKNKATDKVPHPILGDIPICERCKNIIAKEAEEGYVDESG